MSFRIGDKVFSIRLGNGVVTGNDIGSTYPVEVDFEKGESEDFTSKGLLYAEDPIRNLYHGHNLHVQVNEVLPQRECSEWIVRWKESGNISPRSFESEKDAREYILDEDDATFHEIKVLK